MPLRVSVVVPTYRRPELLRRCLKALLAQNFDPSTFEVIVVDDAASQSTEQLVAEMAEQAVAYRYLPRSSHPVPASTEGEDRLGASLHGGPDYEPYLLGQGDLVEVKGLPVLRYLAVQGTHGPASARNLGWQSAKGEIVAFTDDDCIPSPDWLQNGMAAFDPTIAGVAGLVSVPVPNPPTDYELNALGLEDSHFVTANCFYRRSVLAEVGGFDPSFTLAWREDTDLYFNLLEGDYPLRLANDAVVLHPVRPAPWGVSLLQQKKSKFNALLYKKHPQLYREYIQAKPPLHYYAIVGLALASGAAFLIGSDLLGAVLLAAWAGLTIHFAWWRLRPTSRSPRHVTEMLLTSIGIPFLAVFWRLWGAVKYRVWFI